MRFNLFGFKGTLDTLDGSNSTKQPKEDKGTPTVICTGYRPFSEFDTPIDPPPQQTNHATQASTSRATTNGVIPKSKGGKFKIQPETSSKDKDSDKAKATRSDKSKEQKQQKDAAKARKSEEKIKAQQLKEQQAFEKQKKQKEGKKKIKQSSSPLIPQAGPAKSESSLAAAFMPKPKASSKSRSKSKDAKAPGTPPMPVAINPIILAKQQQRKDGDSDKSKHKSVSSEDVELRHKGKSSSRQREKTKTEILKDKAKSLPNLTNPELDKSEYRNGIADPDRTTKTPSNDVNNKHKTTPPKAQKTDALSIPTHTMPAEIKSIQNDLPEDGSISVVSGKTTHKTASPGAVLALPPMIAQKSKPANSDSDDYDNDQNDDGSIFIVSGKTNAYNKPTLNVTIPPPIAPQRSKKSNRTDLPDDGSLSIVSGKTTNAALPPLPVPSHRSKPPEEVPASKAKSLPNLANSDLLDDYDDYQNDLQDDGSFFIVAGKTTAAPSNDENHKKSTLIFMTEGDEDDETPEYGYYTSNTTGKEDTRIQGDYSSHATNIFFGNTEPEPAPRNRKFLVRNDDDNASQTSA